MGFIDAVRAWLFGADEDIDDADEPSGETGAGAETEPTDADASDADGPDGLDPSGVTETRTADATDDAVDALRDVRQSQGAGDDDEPTPAGDGEARPPDDDRTKPSDEGGTNR
ncbi:hypothetical protein ABNG03_14010 [Halorubrum sp. RMP-47]|uniref:Uncharacterized protein n=1 Tax=Halorubrum miltondacostae TaxID=3076378 RepID=A0ABD5M690_9EURY